MDGWVPILFLMVVLKVPVGMLLYIVWWALHAHTEPEEAPESGADDHHFGRFRREPKRPRDPRRGPPTPDCLPLPAESHERCMASGLRLADQQRERPGAELIRLTPACRVSDVAVRQFGLR